MSKKDDLGPMGNHLRSLHEARAYGKSTNAWATEQARTEKQVDANRRKSNQSASSKNTNTDQKVICTELVRQGLFDRADYLLSARYCPAWWQSGLLQWWYRSCADAGF